jgi:ribosomal protein S18 acetylase RimI-like enzyme
MEFLIREYDREKDYESFMKTSFETLISVKGTPPGTSREEFYDWAKNWADGYITELDLNTIFITESQNGDYCGHIWFSLEDDLKPWEFEKYFWIQNITINKDFRNRGLGTKLMKHAEDWIKMKKFQNIALHVNIESKDAISLYRTLNYTEYRTQLIKCLNLSSSKGLSTKENYRNKYIRKIETLDELGSLRDVIFESFKLKLRNQAHEKKLLKVFEVYFNSLKQKNENTSIFKILNKKNEIGGYFIISESEWRYSDSILINDIGFIDISYEKQYFPEACSFIEHWTSEKGISFIQVNLSKNQSNLLKMCKERDFKIIGYFMEKKLD